jgi:energy-converting hydrogenase B subunit Q
MTDAPLTFLLETDDVPGVLSSVSSVFASHDVNIRSIQTLTSGEGRATMTIEVASGADSNALVSDLRALPVVHRVDREPSLLAIYGKRVIIIGGGAQVGQVAVGAISEADRHNIRGERISVDTIPLVGEQALAAAVLAVARLPRARILVLAGALMGGAIADAVREIQRRGLIVIALNMVGSVREVADLVVTDPLQAGVMAVMAIADTATFDVARQRGRRY